MSFLDELEQSGTSKSGTGFMAELQAMNAVPQAVPADAKPKEGLISSALGGAGNSVYGAAMGLADPVYGISRLALEGANKLSGGALDKQTQQYRDYLKGIEQTYQEDTPGSIPAGTGRFLGNMVMPAKGAGAGSTLAAKVGSGMLTGAGMSAVLPIHNIPEDSGYWTELAKRVGLGTVIGGAIPGAVGGLGAAGKAIGQTFNPIVAPSKSAAERVAQGISETAPDAAAFKAANPGDSFNREAVQEVVNKLQNIPNFVPGSMPTTAQVLANPAMVMAEKTLRNNPESALDFINRGNLNNAARLGQVLGVAKTPESLEQAITSRAATTGPMYDAALAKSIPLDEIGQTILQRPIAQQALSRGEKLAQNLNNGTTNPVLLKPGVAAVPPQAIKSGILDAAGNPISSGMTAGSEAIPAQLTGQGLQYTKMGLDALKKEGQFSGMPAAEQRAIDKTKNELRQWFEQKAPEYAEANQTYAKASVPINTMQAGQSLHNILTDGRVYNTVGDAAPTLGAYRTGLAKVLKESKYGIDPQAQKVLENVQKDMQRESISNGLRFSGSDTAFNLQAPNWLAKQLYGAEMSGDSPIAKALGAGLGFVGGSVGGGVGGVAGALGGKYAAGKLGEFAGKNVEKEFQKMMLDPEYARQALAAALMRDAASKQGGAKASDAFTRGGVTGAEGVFQNR